MKHFAFIVLLIVTMGLGLSSCVKEKNFPVQPVIEFKEYVKYGLDSADCTIKFKDGDGDIGNMEGDTVINLKMKYLWKDTTDGLFKPYDATQTDTTFDTLYYSYIIKNLTPDGQYKALDGEIKVKLRAAPIYVPGDKTVKFDITLRDRAGHVSNMVSTNEINLP